jgi:retron-type reverse transcriptase
MKSFKHLFPQICSFENLLLAAKKAQRGQRFKPAAARFNFELEEELLRLQEELQTKTWKAGPYTEFHVYEPKKRLISAAPYRDRVVHHALCNVVEPLFDRTLIHDTYACRAGKGTHRAIERFSLFCRQQRYVLKCDIQKYFPSIDHQILYGLLARKIHDPDALWLIRAIIDSSNPQVPVHEYFPGDDLFAPFERRRGIPIGNLTSQFFANTYLNGFDHFVKEELRCACYLRYMDDFAVLDDNKGRLHEVKAAMGEYLAGLRLKLHPDKCQVFPATQGTDFLGFRIFPTHRLLRRGNAVRFRRKLRHLAAEYAQGEADLPAVLRSLQSWNAHASWGNTWRLREKLYNEVTFQRRYQSSGQTA